MPLFMPIICHFFALFVPLFCHFYVYIFNHKSVTIQGSENFGSKMVKFMPNRVPFLNKSWAILYYYLWSPDKLWAILYNYIWSPPQGSSQFLGVSACFSDFFFSKKVAKKVAQKLHKKWHKKWHKSGPWSEIKLGKYPHF